ncbi:MAG: tetratricopeptide repeat protein [Lachnospiraceae bacterium]|nr:tetratricopeptide repeat protein [Lachnospiraceae bacterium]
MTRLDFHSVISIFIENQKNADISQIDFMYCIFATFINDESTDFVFDNGLVCHWIKGKMRISPKIVNYYITQSHQSAMHNDMEHEVFPFISDPAFVALEIKQLLTTDSSVSAFEKDRLLNFLSEDSVSAYAAFIAEALIFGMSRSFVKAGSKSTTASPLIEDMILTTNIPKPVETFTGRETELETLNQLLQENSLVFLSGIPGIGKSEVAKAYLKQYKKNYTNILYLEYTNSLYEMIADLDFADDTDSLSEKERFRKHFRFLKTLKADSLIVIDNFNTTASEETLLNQVCNLKCHLLITTRNHFNIGTELIIESNKELALHILQQNIKATTLDILQKYSNEVELLLETVSFHTMSAAMIGRLLSYKNILPTELNRHLQENVLLPDNQTRISMNKDNRAVKSEYQDIMQNLLRYNYLTPAQQQTLSITALAPEDGFPLRCLYNWYSDCTNEINDLEELGLLAVKHDSVTLNPYIRKLVNAGKHLAISNCDLFWRNLQAKCQDMDNETTLFALQIIDTALRFIQKDNKQLWISVVRTALECNHRLHRYRSYSNLLNEYEYLCLDKNIRADDDQYLLFHFKAIEAADIHANINKAIQWEEQAITTAGENGTSHILNFSTLYLDAGRYYHIQGNLKKALDYTQKSTDMLLETKMQYSPNGISSLIQYARYLFECNQFNDAIRIYQNCLNIINATWGDSCLTYGYIAQNLAAILASMKQPTASLRLFNKAISILEHLLGSGHEDVNFCKKQIIELQNTSKPALLVTPPIPVQITA